MLTILQSNLIHPLHIITTTTQGGTLSCWFVCVCMCVCVCMRAYVYVCMCVCVCVFVCMHAECVCMHVCVHMCTYLHVYVCIRSNLLHTYIPINAHMHSDTVLTLLLVWSFCSVSRFYLWSRLWSEELVYMEPHPCKPAASVFCRSICPSLYISLVDYSL